MTQPLTTHQPPNHGIAGLTLLEILAATLIFSMVMTVLISTSSTAVHHVGVSARRLEASALADEILADLEIQMKQGVAPLVDEDESVLDQFEIRIVRSDILDEVASGAAAGSGVDVAALLGAELPEVAKHLKQYDIEVLWIEQSGPQTVTRTTFAYDWQAASVEFTELFDRASRSNLATNQLTGGGDGDAAGGGNTEGSNRNGSSSGAPNPNADSNCGNGRNARLRALAQGC